VKNPKAFYRYTPIVGAKRHRFCKLTVGHQSFTIGIPGSLQEAQFMRMCLTGALARMFDEIEQEKTRATRPV